jgi:uncharacterized protein
VWRLTILHACILFTGTWLEAVPFLLLGILFSACVRVFVPDGYLEKVFPRNKAAGIVFGVTGGFFLPVCDCASVPVFRSLVRKGIPFSAAVAFLLAAPVINPVVMLSTWYAYGGNFRMVIARSVCGVICAVFAAVTFIGKRPEDYCRTDKVSAHCDSGKSVAGASFFEKCSAVVYTSRHEFVEAGSWQIVGIAVATLFQTVVSTKNISGIPVHFLSGITGTFLSIVIMMILAYCLSLCSTSDAVICSVLGNKFPPEAQLAFLVFGPMMDIKNTILLGGLCSPRLSVRMIVTTFVLCFLVMILFTCIGGVSWIL